MGEIEHVLLPGTQTDLLKETAKVPSAEDPKASARPPTETSHLGTSSCREKRTNHSCE